MEIKNTKKTKIERYIIAFVITTCIFLTAIYISNIFANKRINEIKNIESKISVDILSSETQFDLLRSTSCSLVDESLLSKELNDLASRLSYMEEKLGLDDSEVIHLKKYYSLLQIKDYLLMQKLSEQCKLRPISLLYFYSNKGDCAECSRMGYVLTRLREQYPNLRVYSFDYNIDLSAVKTLIGLYKINKALPAIVIHDKAYYGFKDILEIEKMLPELNVSSTTATSTATTTKKK